MYWRVFENDRSFMSKLNKNRYKYGDAFVSSDFFTPSNAPNYPKRRFLNPEDHEPPSLFQQASVACQWNGGCSMESRTYGPTQSWVLHPSPYSLRNELLKYYSPTTFIQFSSFWNLSTIYTATSLSVINYNPRTNSLSLLIFLK